DLLSVEQDFTRGRRAALKFLEALDVQIDRLFRVEVSEFEPLHKAVDERLADLRLFLDRRTFAGGDDAAHLDAVVLVVMALISMRLAQNVGAMLPKKLPITLSCLSAAARIKPGASIVMMLTLPASMPVALTKAGQTWNLPR